MILEIDNEKKLSQLNNIFNTKYPFLKLEFYDQPHAWQEESSSKHILNKTMTVGEATPLNLNSGIIEIHFWQKTGLIEKIFKNKFGLFVQIFRQHGDKWVQSVGTDELTLEQQNEAGSAATREFIHDNLNRIEVEKSY